MKDQLKKYLISSRICSSSYLCSCGRERDGVALTCSTFPSSVDLVHSDYNLKKMFVRKELLFKGGCTCGIEYPIISKNLQTGAALNAA